MRNVISIINIFCNNGQSITYLLIIILIASNFFFSVPVTDIHLVFGKYDFLVKDELYGNVTRKLQTVITHPKFKSNETNYDLALLKFDKPVKFQPNILPVCIPEDDFNFVGYSARVTGWGTLYYGKHCNNIFNQ